MAKFLTYHRQHNAPLDARVERKLRSQPPWVQHAVIERGECSEARGSGAVVIQRIVDLRRWYQLPREDEEQPVPPWRRHGFGGCAPIHTTACPCLDTWQAEAV